MKIKNNTEKGYLEAEEGVGINISGRMAQQRGNVQKGMCQTINTMGTDGGVAVYDERSERERERESSCLRIRKLTPLECLKLMGFDENDYKALKEIQSDSAIYHEAGDSLGVPLFALLVNEMLETDKRQKVLDYIDTLKGDYDEL